MCPTSLDVMEEYGISFEGMSRKKRSHTFRRPPPDYGASNECHDVSSLSSTPPQHEESKASSDENTRFGSTSTRKEVNINQLVSSFPAASRSESERSSKRSRKEGVRLDGSYTNNENKRSSEGLFAPANRKSLNDGKTESGIAAAPHLSHDGTGNENKVIKVTLKVGGATRTIDTNSGDKSVRSSEASASRQKPMAKVGSEDDHYRRSKRLGLQGIPWKDFSTVGFTLWRESSSTGSMSDKNHSVKQGEHSDPVRKSKRAPKKVVTFDDEDEDEEIRYLEKLKNIKHCSGYKDDEEEFNRKHRRLSAVSGIVGETMGSNVGSKSVKDGKRKSQECSSNGEVFGKFVKREMTLTTRQRALQSGKDPSASGLIEFPDGLPPAPSRKKKEKLTDVELQLKKVEAAKRRKLQNEKAEREIQEEAIRKILGQDSSRQKREEKKKKRQEELAQEKAADELRRQSNCIRIIDGPNGTTVTFPNEMGLPSIFNSKPFRYPPPQEKCAGPSCTNPYKYRDSKTNLPLCSLQCYKRVQANIHRDSAASNDINTHQLQEQTNAAVELKA